MEKNIQPVPKYGETPGIGYDRLLTAEELSRELIKSARCRKREKRKDSNTGIMNKTAKFLGSMKFFI